MHITVMQNSSNTNDTEFRRVIKPAMWSEINLENWVRFSSFKKKGRSRSSTNTLSEGKKSQQIKNNYKTLCVYYMPGAIYTYPHISEETEAERLNNLPNVLDMD